MSPARSPLLSKESVVASRQKGLESLGGHFSSWNATVLNELIFALAGARLHALHDCREITQAL